jgi:Zn-dependent peptidase ImmA (M78 family)
VRRRRLSYSEIETRAWRALTRAGTFDAPTAVPVHEVARALGLTVELAALGDGVSGVLVVNDGVGVIGVNRAHAPVRQRFSIAHEIGHFELHRSEGQVFIDKGFGKVTAFFRDSTSGTGVDRQEIEANAFAAALLMPRQLVEQAFTSLSADFDLGGDDAALDRLARLFGVSREAMSFRLSNLGLLSLA